MSAVDVRSGVGERRVRRTAAARLTAAAATASLAVIAPTAQAAARDGICQAGELCLYFNSDQAGSVSDFATSIADYGATQPDCYEFKSAGAGQDLCVKNAAASVWNRTSGNVTVFNSSYGGASQTFGTGVMANLNATLKNQNASHRLGGTTPPSGSYGAPGTNPHPEAITRAPSATARTQFVDNEIARLTGETQCWVGDYRSY